MTVLLFNLLIAVAVTLAASAVVAFILTNVVVGYQKELIPCTSSAISATKIGKTSRSLRWVLGRWPVTSPETKGGNYFG